MLAATRCRTNVSSSARAPARRRSDHRALTHTVPCSNALANADAPYAPCATHESDGAVGVCAGRRRRARCAAGHHRRYHGLAAAFRSAPTVWLRGCFAPGAGGGGRLRSCARSAICGGRSAMLNEGGVVPPPPSPPRAIAVCAPSSSHQSTWRSAPHCLWGARYRVAGRQAGNGLRRRSPGAMVRRRQPSPFKSRPSEPNAPPRGDVWCRGALFRCADGWQSDVWRSQPRVGQAKHCWLLEEMRGTDERQRVSGRGAFPRVHELTRLGRARTTHVLRRGWVRGRSRRCSISNRSSPWPCWASARAPSSR